MKTTTFICDVCKKSVGGSELFEVSANVLIPKQPGGYSQSLVSDKKDVCRGCLREKGLIVEAPAGDEERNKVNARNQKTFENKFVELLEEIGVAFVE